MATALNIIEQAFQELGVAVPTELDGADATFGLAKLNRLLDNWNADQAAVYAETFPTFTTTASLSPHTIGLVANTPTWTVLTNRPVSIEAANLVTGSGASAYRTPITIRDRQWWANKTFQALTSTIPTDLYYDPTWPNGSVYLWPVPSSSALTIELHLRVLLAQLALATTFTLPPGYQDAITLTLAEDLATPYHVGTELLSILAKKAREARTRVFANNIPVPRLQTVDAGMPGSSVGSGWDYNIGGYR